MHNCQLVWVCNGWCFGFFFAGLLFLLLNFERNQGVILFFVWFLKNKKKIRYLCAWMHGGCEWCEQRFRQNEKHNHRDDENEAYNNMNNHIKKDFIQWAWATGANAIARNQMLLPHGFFNFHPLVCFSFSFVLFHWKYFFFRKMPDSNNDSCLFIIMEELCPSFLFIVSFNKTKAEKMAIFSLLDIDKDVVLSENYKRK